MQDPAINQIIYRRALALLRGKLPPDLAKIAILTGAVPVRVGLSNILYSELDRRKPV